MVVLGWSPGDDVDLDRFVILWSREPGGPTVEVASVPAERNGYEDLAPRPGVGYYSVVSIDAVGNRSDPSDEIEVVVPPPVVIDPVDPVIVVDVPNDEDETDEIEVDEVDEIEGGDGDETGDDATGEPEPDEAGEAGEVETEVEAEPFGLEETDAPELADALAEPDDEDSGTDDDTEPDEPETDEDVEEGDDSDQDDDTEEEQQRELEEQPEQQTAIYGNVTGDVDDIATADGTGQRLTETLSGGAESARHDRLDHRWLIEPADGNQELWIVAEVGDDAGDADDGFVIAWSIDRVEWTDLVTIFPGESIDDTFDIGAPDDTVHVRVNDTDRTPRQQSPDSIFVDALRVIGDGLPVEPEPEPTEALAEIDFHYQGLGEGERAVVVTASVRDDRGEPVVGAVVEVEVQGDIAETVTITTGRNGRGEEQTEGAALRPEVEVCIDAIEVEGLTTSPSPNDCAPSADTEDTEDTDTEENDTEDTDTGTEEIDESEDAGDPVEDETPTGGIE